MGVVSRDGSAVSAARAAPAVSGAQIIVESLYAVLALGSIMLFGLRYTSVFGAEFRELALLLDYLVCIFSHRRRSGTFSGHPTNVIGGDGVGPILRHRFPKLKRYAAFGCCGCC